MQHKIHISIYLIVVTITGNGITWSTLFCVLRLQSKNTWWRRSDVTLNLLFSSKSWKRQCSPLMHKYITLSLYFTTFKKYWRICHNMSCSSSWKIMLWLKWHHSASHRMFWLWELKEQMKLT